MDTTVVLSTETSLNWTTIGQGIVMTAAVLTALGVIVNRLMAFIRKLHHEFADEVLTVTKPEFDSINTRLNGVDEQIALVNRELAFNGGHSLKDAVFDIRKKMEEAK